VTWRRKVEVVRRGLDRHTDVVAAAAVDPIGVLTAFGGLEHAALAGFVLAGAAARVPVVLDGVIAAAAALAVRALAPDALAGCIAGHRSVEPGHAVALAVLGGRPLVDLDLRLGEGTGAVLALPLVQAAARALRDMATFDAAGVVDKGSSTVPAEP
jgi:nicotinate-nucleotide--dimethylbenzimidazole phosphoribosyltransferase